MSERAQYFRKFPVTDYAGAPAINITRRAALNSEVKNFLSAFYTYTMSIDDRIEHLAYNYYDDVDLDWLIYHANDIIDPQYQVPLSTDEFDDFVVSKYGSIRNAKRKILYYENNYLGDERVLSTSGYLALDGGQRKYWEPVHGPAGVTGYQRSSVDFRASTNKIISLPYTTAGSLLTVGEIVTRDDQTDGSGTVAWSNTTSCVVQHVSGEFTANSSYTITSDSDVTVTVDADNVVTLDTVIPETEQQFFSPVTAFDVEEKENENRREIYLVERGYKDKVNKQLTNILK